MYYVLDDNHVPREATLIEWSAWFRDHTKRVAETTLPDGRWISTVFLGLDHGFGSGDPVLFETMVFASRTNLHDERCERYTSWEAAVAGHAQVVAELTTPGVRAVQFDE